MQLSERDIKKLNTVHPDLQKVIYRAAEITEVDFVITCGIRTLEEQERLVAEGKSKTLKSKHLTGEAVDLACWFDKDSDKVVDADEISWKFEHYKKLSQYVKIAAQEQNIKIVWGGDWTSFKDGPHFQLDR